MGKISDALEKAHKQPVNKDATFPKIGKESGPRDARKVVPLSNFNTPFQDQNLDGNMITYHAPQSIEAESFKVLRTNLLFPSEGKPPKSIMVTSAIPGDGKSFVSANLAISIAQGVEEHVLLIDSDIRKPSMDNYLGIKSTHGLSEYLATGTDIAKFLHKTPIQKLTVLPAGKPPQNPTELLTTQKMNTLIKEVAKRYDDRYIILDSAPPSVASETAAIAKYVDAIIIVIRAGVTSKNAVTEVIELLGKDKIIGIVLNRANYALKKYYGYGKSYYKPKSNNP